MTEEKAYLSRKHKLYGLKIEVSVFSVGLVAFLTQRYSVFNSYITTILRRNRTAHQRFSAKADYGRAIANVSEYLELFPAHRGKICDKDYQAAHAFLRVLHK